MDNYNAFNLVDVWEVMRRRWKPVAVLVITVTLFAGLLTIFVLPKQYESKAVLVAANPALTDKQRITGTNIQDLYSPYGTGDDLNRLLAIARLDSMYYRLVNEFGLVRYYGLESKTSPAKAAAQRLKKELKIEKTENDELIISILTRQPELSSKLVNKMVQLIDSTASRAWKNEYQQTLNVLQQEIGASKDIISDSHTPSVEVSATIKNAQQRLEGLQHDYRVALANNPSAMVVLQWAYPSPSPDAPNLMKNLLAAFFTALVFAIIAAIVYDRKQPV